MEENIKRLTVAEYAAAAGISTQAVYKQIKKRSLKVVKEGKQNYIVVTNQLPTAENESCQPFTNHEEIIKNAFNAYVDSYPTEKTFDDFVEEVTNQCNPGYQPMQPKYATDATEVTNQNAEILQTLKDTIALQNKHMEAYAAQIEMLQSMIQEKDRQISELNERLKEQNKSMSEALTVTDQQQKLQLLAVNKIKELEAQNEADQEAQPETVRHWWQFWK